jgi:LGFP repeat
MPADELKQILFRGLTTNQLVINEDVAQLSDEASVEYMREINKALQSPIVIWPGMNHGHFANSRHLKPELTPTVTEILREINAANNAIDTKHRQVASVLGNPTASLEYGANGGFYRKFEQGAIYLNPQKEAFEVHGAIYQKYLTLGAEVGFLGYPQTDELSTTLGTGRFNHFQGGSIYWTSPTGAWEIHGAIRDKWWALEGDRSHLGYPISDEEDWTEGTGRISHFQYGSIVFRSADGNVLVQSESVILRSSLSTASVTCSLELWMNSAGDWRYKGHMHNSGFVGFSVNVASIPLAQDASGNIFVRGVEKHLGGTTAAGSRDYDWDDVGTHEDFIRDNWSALRFAQMRTEMEVDFTFGDFIQLFGAGLPVAIGTLIVGAILAGGKVCGPYGSVKRDPYNGQDTSSVGFEVIPGDQQCPR